MRLFELVSPQRRTERQTTEPMLIISPDFSLMTSQQKVTGKEKEPKYYVMNNKLGLPSNVFSSLIK